MSALPQEQGHHTESAEDPRLAAQAKAELLRYLQTGETDGSFENQPLIQAIRVKELLLKAGYTKLALFCFPHLGSSLIGKDPENIYFQLPDGQTFGISELPNLLQTLQPDFPPGKDRLQKRALQAIEKFSVIKTKLQRAGKKWFALESWDVDQNGIIRFWLNPQDQENYQPGWYTIHDLQDWLENNTQSPIFKQKNR